MLDFKRDAIFILASNPRVERKEVARGETGSEVSATYQVMVLGFGRPRHIGVKVQGNPPRLTEGDQLEFTNLTGSLYRGKDDPGNLSTRVTFQASAVARAQGRQVPEGVQT